MGVLVGEFGMWWEAAERSREPLLELCDWLAMKELVSAGVPFFVAAVLFFLIIFSE